MEIRLEGEYTEQDIKQAILLGFPRGLMAVLVAGAIGLLLVVGIPTIAMVRTVPMEPMALLYSVLPVPILLLIIALFFGGLWLLTLRQARQLAKSRFFKGRFSGVATDEALELHGEAAEFRVQWDAFVRCKMSDNVVLLYQSNSAFHLVPRGLFASDEDWERFREHVQATLPKKAQQRSTFGRLTFGWRMLIYVAIALILGLVFFLLNPQR